MIQKKTKIKPFNCYICGRFMSYSDLENVATYDPTSCSDYEPRDLLFAHKDCVEMEVVESSLENY